MKKSFKLATIMVLGGLLLLSSILGSVASAGDYPDKSINIVVPYKPGGGSDMICRLIDKYQ